MASATYPFPLAARSSHHSHYHSFLLGADAATLDPMPKPYCVGSLDGPVRALAKPLTLPRWRKLYSGAFPWTEGFGPEHYEPANLAAHSTLPKGFCRPVRRYGAYDFVQIADPNVSALALVAGDRRIIGRFMALGDGFCTDLEQAVSAPEETARHPGPGGKILAGQFYEPNNRWLMPLLHVHSRILNFTCHGTEPARLHCLDGARLAKAGRRARQGWTERQASMLGDLGYRVSPAPADDGPLGVEGVDEGLLSAIEAPRMAVLRLLERLVTGERPCGLGRLQAEIPLPVIAAMAGQLEDVLARSLGRFKPAKVDIPARGPWRTAVRGHLGGLCPGSLKRLDAAAARASACQYGPGLLAVPMLDSAHVHAPNPGDVDAPQQGASDPELFDGPAPDTQIEPSAWLAEAFAGALEEINATVAADPRGPAVRTLLRLATRLDRLDCAASAEQLRQSALFLGGELERKDSRRRDERRPGEIPRGHSREPEPELALASYGAPWVQRAHEPGGRSL